MEYRAIFVLRRDSRTGELGMDACGIDEWPFDHDWTEEELKTLKVMDPDHPMVKLVNKFEQIHRTVLMRRRYENTTFGPFYARLGKNMAPDELLELVRLVDDRLREGRQSIGLFPDGFMFDFIVNDPNKTEEVNHED
jgi:hypothetical protein